MNKKHVFIKIMCIIFIILICVIFFLNKSESIGTIRKSVVKIDVYDNYGKIIQTGSGIIVFDKNILITNAHVITGGSSAEAISEADERLYIDGAIYYNQEEDIAILKLNNQNKIKPLKISTKYDVGDKVIAIGSPLGIKNSVSDGIISNILDDKTIQHTAPISSGSSGGALFNSRGKIIGINTATIIDGQNINLSIPIEKIKNVYNKNKNNEVKSIKDIQYLNEDVKSVMLNNSAGKELVEYVNKLEKTSRNVFWEDSRDYKDRYANGYYLYKLAENGIALDWVNITVNDTFDENEKLVESKLPILTIIKVSDTSPETIALIENYLAEDIIDMYSFLSEYPEYSEIKADSLNDGGETYHTITEKFSYDYMNAYTCPIISHYNNYVYAIVSKDLDVLSQIEKIIKKLP